MKGTVAAGSYDIVVVVWSMAGATGSGSTGGLSV